MIRWKVGQRKEMFTYPDQTDLKMEVAKFEAGYLEHAFQRYGNIREAAASLAWTVPHLYGKDKNMSSLDS